MEEIITESVAAANKFFSIRKANGWLRGEAPKRESAMLFDEFWMEGDMAVLLAPPEAGKSVLAMQIAESIARGRSFGPLQMSKKPRRVLYIDLVLTRRQFEKRYSSEETGKRQAAYRFSERLYRAEIAAGEVGAATDPLRDMPIAIERLVTETEAEVLIVDDLDRLRTTNSGTAGDIAFMRELDRLKRRYGLSIMLLARSSGKDPMGAAAKFADSVMTIGRSRIDPAMRYLKHLYSRSGERMYDETCVPTFRLQKIAGKFLGFGSVGIMSEAEHLGGCVPFDRRRRDDEIRRLGKIGLSVRQIGNEMGIPKTTVHRVLRLSEKVSGPPNRAELQPYRISEITANPLTGWFRGCEEYNKELLHERFDFDRETKELDEKLRREYSRLENARVEAFHIQQETGVTVPLAEMLKRFPPDPEPIETIVEEIEHVETVVEEIEPAIPDPEPVIPEPEVVPDAEPEPDIEPEPKPEFSQAGPMAGLKWGVDREGKRIFIEAEDRDGRPLIWYWYKSGWKTRSERTAHGTFDETIKIINHSAKYRGRVG